MKKLISILALCAFGFGLCYAVQLKCETSNPHNNLFTKKDTVELLFSAEGLKAREVSLLILDVRDHREKFIGEKAIPVHADKDGKWRGKFIAPNSKFGFYRVRARLSDGTKLPKLGSRPEGCITYAVLPNPSDRKLYDMGNSFFGIHGNAIGEADLRPWLGARWQGFSGTLTDDEYARWQNEKKSSEWVVYRTRCFVQACDIYSKWDKADNSHLRETFRLGKSKIFADAQGEKIYRKILGEMVAKCAKQKFHNAYNLYQPLWEPDLTMSDDDIVLTYKVAKDVIRKIDAGGKLIGPCFSHLNRDSPQQHKKLFEKGFLDYVDEVSIHPYITYPVELNGLVENIRELKRLVKMYSKGRDIKIRANESGAFLPNDMQSELLQMCGQVRSNLIMMGEGFLSNEPFYGHDHCETLDGDYGLCYNLLLPKTRFGTNRVSPRPSFPALAAASFILDGHKSTGAIEYLADTALGYSYADKNDNCVVALWDFGGGVSEVELAVGNAPVKIADIMGNAKKIFPKEGFVKLKLSGEPLYVIGCDPKIYGRSAERKIVLDKLRISARAGEKAVLSGKVSEGGSLKLSFPKSLKMENLSKKVSANESFSFEFSLPKNLKSGIYSPALVLVKDGRAIAGVSASLQATSPVLIEDVTAMFKGGFPAAGVSIKNMTEENMEGKISTRIPGYPDARKSLDFSLNAGESKFVKIPFEDLEISPLKHADLQIKTALASSYSCAENTKVNFMKAQYLPDAGKNFSNWKNPQFVNASAISKNAGLDSEKNGSAKIAYAWNDKYLFVRAEFVQGAQLQEGNKGARFDFGFARKRSVKSNANKFAEDYQLGFSRIDALVSQGGAQLVRTASFDVSKFPLGEVSFSQKSSVKILKDGRLCREFFMAVPWANLNIKKPASGMNIAVAAEFKEGVNGDLKFAAFALKQPVPSGFGLLVLQ